MKQREMTWKRTREWLTRNAIWLILLLAWLLALYQIDARTWHGDELSSVANALGSRQNPQAIAYFLLLRVWLWGGNSEFWLRTLSAWFAVLNVAIAFRAVELLASRRTAIVVSVLFATSPFVLEFAHQVRFYTVFLTAASASLWALLYYLKQRTRRAFFIWLGITVVMLSTHAMSFVVLLFELLTLWLVVPRMRLRYRIGALILAVGLGVLVMVSPLRAPIFAVVARYTDAAPVFDQSRGISISQLAKLPLTLFFFALGQYVYPLDWYLVIPGVLLYVAAIGLGIYRMRQAPAQLLLLVLLGLGAPLLLYVALDALIPTTFAGAAPRYLIFLLPVFYFLAGVGVASWRWGFALASGLVLVNLFAVNSMWRGDWAYTDDLVDWRAVTRFVSENFTPHTRLVLDGRANGNARFYFPPEYLSGADAPFDTPEVERVIAISNDFHDESRTTVNERLRDVQTRFTLERVWSRYPAFVYVFQQQDKPPNTFAIDNETGRIEQPVEIPGIEFQDVTLPAQANFREHALPLYGTFAVTENARIPRRVDLAQPRQAQTLWLLSNVLGNSGDATNNAVAELTIEYVDGTRQTTAVRPGSETGWWDGACDPCETAFQWRKRLALVGASAYPGSWRDFQARVFAAPIALDATRAVKSITFTGTSPSKTLYVWGLFLR